jgi:hypothetical protein
MITDKDRELREHMRMKQFTFMLDDVTKLKVLQKLKENGLETKKGSMSALIRVMLNQFCEMNEDGIAFNLLLQEVEKEYLFTTKKNKRSTM